MTRIFINGIHLNIETAGRGQPFVLLHGFTGSAANWRAHVDVCAPHFTVVAVDLLGHGQSDSPPDPARYRMEHCVEDLIAILDQLQPKLQLKPVNLLGYSMGGRAALHLAAVHPERVGKLILESASPGVADPAERAARAASDNALADFIEQAGLEAFIDRWEALPLFASQARLPAELRAALRAQRRHNDPRGLANSLRGLGTGIQSPLWERLPDINVPALLLAGELDTKFVSIARALAGSLPNARLEIVPGAGHAVHLEQPEVFDRLVLDWLLETPTPEAKRRGVGD
jgi:2-succinyl-6-hydroxy-2,4-cyclohexadiene-1-carboxylate synthase